MTDKSLQQSELRAAFARCRNGIIAVGVLSAALNILALGGSIYMMLIYDRVLPSHSVATLLGLLLFVVVIYLFQGFFEVVRGRMLMQIGSALDISVMRRIHDLVGTLQMKAPQADGLQPVRDLDSVRGFLSGYGLPAFLDLPWALFFIGVLYLMHPLLGLTALGGAVLLLVLTLLTEKLSRKPTRDATLLAAKRTRMADNARRHAELIQALGMRQRLADRWAGVSENYLAAQQKLFDVTGSLSSTSKILRLLLQSLVLTVGAWLVIQNEATGGVIFAGSVIAARALAPVELAIANWRGFVAARDSWSRLERLLHAAPRPADVLQLPPPMREMTAEGVVIAPPGTQRVTAQDVSFRLKAGDVLLVIGPSASGKSSLARGLVGVWPLLRGKVRLDGAALEQWQPDELGRHIGYLPQNVELLEGTVAQNIARFDPNAEPNAIIEAAQRAGVHDLILRLPNGYETEVGADGEALSAGQKQRIALARALYLDPFFVVLDEPNSNLDAEGDVALITAIGGVRERGGVAVVVAHRPSLAQPANLVLFMRDGRMADFGPKEEVLPRILRQPPGAAAKAQAQEASA